MKQTLTDVALIVLTILAFGALSYWLHWDDADAPVKYQIRVEKIERPKYVRT